MFPLATLALFSTALAAPWGPPGHPGPGGYGPDAKALYFLENNPAGSAIVALRIGQDGLISDPVRTSTHGFGAYELNATTGEPVAADTLGSQDSVVVSGNLLFTVNAGSNTVVMFTIDPEDPYHPKLVGEPASSNGDFPMAVAYSDKLKTACVVNSGVVSGVQCYSVDYKSGLKPTGPFREFPKTVVDESNPPAGPPGQTGDVFFTPDSSAVLVTVKGGSGTPPAPGYVVSYPVSKGVVSTKAIEFQSPNIFVAFGAKWVSETKLLLTDAASGVDLLNVSEDGTITELANTPIPGQQATCWADYDASLRQAYAMDAAAPKIYLINPSTGALEGDITVEESLGGVLDEAILDNMMYLATQANGVVVVDLKEKKQVQFLNLTSFSDRQYYQGMAIFSGYGPASHW